MVDSSIKLPAAERDSMEYLRNRVLCRCQQDHQKLKLSVTHELLITQEQPLELDYACCKTNYLIG